MRVSAKVFALVMAGVSSPAMAQVAAEAPVEADAADAPAILVTGIRASLQNNAQIKKNASEIVDSITATDIGKLPDPNIAETLTRVPGVQAYRFGGEAASPAGIGSGITIRGLTGQTGSRVNGRTFFTAGQREFGVADISPAMVAGVDVFKNPTAEHIEGGIGGLVNVRTRRPLDLKGFTASVSVGAKYNDLAEKAKPEVFGLISDRWNVGDGELGVLIGASYGQTINRGDNTPGAGGISFRRPINAASAEYAAGVTSGLYSSSYLGRSDVTYLATATPSSVPLASRSSLISVLGENPTTGYEQYVRTRTGLNAVIQYKPNPDLEIYAEGLYNRFRYNQEFGFLGTTNSRYVQNLATRDFQATEGLADRNLNGGDDELLAGKLLTGGTFLGSGASVTSGLVNNTSWAAIGSVGTRWRASDSLSVDFDVSYNKARVENNQRVLTFVAAQGRTFDITRDLSQQPSYYTFGGADPANAANWVYGQYNAGPNIAEDDGIAVRLDLVRTFEGSLLENIKVGGRFATQNDTFRNFAYSPLPLTTNGAALTANQSNAIAISKLGVITNAPNNFMDGMAGYTGGYVTYDPSALAGNNITYLFPQAGIPFEGSELETLSNRRRFEEKTYAGYAMANFATAERNIRANIGVRIVRTDTFTRSGAGTGANEGNSTYTNVLPTANLTWYATPDTLIRLGYGKGITRPDPGNLNPSIIVNQANGNANLGNANLRPQKGDSYDISAEHYFSASNYASVGLFYKRIDGFFSAVTSCQTVPGFTYTGAILNGCSNGEYLVTQNVNAQTGTVKGVEVAGQTFLDYDFLPEFLHKFGTSASFTYVDTKNPVLLSTGIVVETRQPFTSKYNYTLAGFYENDTFSARVVYTYRSRSQFQSIGKNPVDGRYIVGFGLLDASLNVNVTPRLQLSLTASNLTNKAPQRFYGEEGYFTGVERQHFVNGRIFGASARFAIGS